jgi:hypothetical protein
VTADLPRISELILESWRRAYASLVPQRFLADLDVHRIRERWEHHLLVNEFSLVATVQSDVVGVCQGTAKELRVSDVALRPENHVDTSKSARWALHDWTYRPRNQSATALSKRPHPCKSKAHCSRWHCPSQRNP